MMQKQEIVRDFPDGKYVYIVDTNVLMYDSKAVEVLSADGNIVVLPVCLLFELDNSKNFSDTEGYNSRAVARHLDVYRTHGHLNDAVKTKSGGMVVVDSVNYDYYFNKKLAVLKRSTDNRLIAAALAWKEDSRGKYKKVALVTRDKILRIKANAFGIFTEDYQNDKVVKSIEDLYTGFAKVGLSADPKDVEILFNQFPKSRAIPLEFLTLHNQKTIKRFFPNQCLEINIRQKTILAIYKKQKNQLNWVDKPAKLRRQHGEDAVLPKNREQSFLYSLLSDDEIDCVTVTGRAGTGKTLISLLVAIEQGKKVLICRPNIEIGEKIGYLPGKIEEKFEPWMRPIMDNLNLICGHKNQHKDKFFGRKNKNLKNSDLEEMTLEYLSKGLEILPLNHIRGRSLNNYLVIVDDSQNLKRSQAKAIITRAGQNTKMILTGDCGQVDDPHLDCASNGLSHTVERFKGEEIAATIMLRGVVRSPLAELAGRKL